MSELAKVNPPTEKDKKRHAEMAQAFADNLNRNVVKEHLQAQLASNHADALKRLKQARYKPTQCHLWTKETLEAQDLNGPFDVLCTYAEDSHSSRRLVQCKDCGQLYLKEFHEEIDWKDGEDPQYMTLIPVAASEDATTISRVGLFELQSFIPRLNWEWPKDQPKRTYWIGR